MDLLEYQGKQLFARHDIPVPRGQAATTVEEAVAAAREIGFPCAVKAQVQIGGRGKLGGIKIAADESQARRPAVADRAGAEEQVGLEEGVGEEVEDGRRAKPRRRGP